MSNSLDDYEYLKFIEPHLGCQIMEFILKKHPENQEILKMYKSLLFKGQDFEKQKEYKIYDEKQIEELKTKKAKEEEEIEEKLKGFLNLCENCKKQNNYELNSFALGKKIVKKIFNFYKLDR